MADKDDKKGGTFGPPKPKGTIRHDHCKLISIDMESDELENKSGWCVELTYKSKFQDKWEPKTLLVPGSKLEGNALKVPANKAALKGYKMLDGSEKNFEFTIIQEKGDEYWNVIDIVPGHVGRAGYQNDPAGNSGQSSGGNFSGDAAAGQLINLAVAYLTANKTSYDDTDDFLDQLEKTSVDLVQGYTDLKDKLKGMLQKDAPKASSKPVVQESDSVDSEDDDLDNPEDTEDSVDDVEVPVQKQKQKAKAPVVGKKTSRPAPAGDEFD